MRDAFAALSEAKKQPHFLALADLLTLYLCTRTWVAATEYRSFRSDPVPIHTCDIPCSCSCTYRIHEGQPLDEDELTMHYDSPPSQAPAVSHNHYYLGEEAVASAEEARWSALSEEARLEALLGRIEGVGELHLLLSEQGAAVVCAGADDAGVRLEICQALHCYTGLGSDRIQVFKLKSN